MTDRSRLTIVQLNDVHAYLDSHGELFWEGGRDVYRQAGGYARIATILKQARAEANGAVLALDNGDTLHGTYPAVKTQGRVLTPVLNALGLAAMTAHWDFGYGPQVLRERVGELSYPLLAANVYDRATGALSYPSRVVKEVGGLRVGVVGLASNIVDKTMPPHFSEGLRFALGRDELPGIVDRLRGEEKVDLVVLLSHLGFPQDMKLLAEVPGVDVCLSGHTHDRLYRPVRQGQTLVIQSGSHGSFVGRLDLEVAGGRVVDYRHDLIEVRSDFAPDPEVAGLVEDALAPYRAELAEVVGETATPLHRNTMLEAPMDDLLLASLLDATGARVAFSNGWRYGAPILPGPITLNDLYDIIPMNPPVSTVELTGEELREMLEENVERTFSGDAFALMGGYLKRALGIRAFLKLENPRGEHVVRLFVGDEEVRPGDRYLAAFVTEQGVPPRYGQGRQSQSIRAVEAMRHYLARKRPFRAAPRGTFTLI